MAGEASSTSAATLEIKLVDAAAGELGTATVGAPQAPVTGSPPTRTTADDKNADAIGKPPSALIGAGLPNGLGGISPVAGAVTAALKLMEEAVKSVTRYLTEESEARAANNANKPPLVSTGSAASPVPAGQERFNFRFDSGSPQAVVKTGQSPAPMKLPTAGQGPGNDATNTFAKAAAVTASLTVAMRSMEDVVRTTTHLLTAESQARSTLIASNDVQRAEIARQRGWSSAIGRIPILGGLASSIIDANTAQKENQLREQDAWRQRAIKLGQYSPRISMELARGETQQISREVAESQLYGGAHARMVELQNQQQRLKDQIALAERSKSYDRDMKRLQDENNRLTRELGLAMVGLTNETKKLIKSLPYGGDPLGKLLQGMQIPDDHRPRMGRENHRQRDVDLNAPILGGRQ